MNTDHLRLSRQASISVLATASVYGRNFLLIPLLTRYLNAGEYGAWVQIISLVEVLSVAGTLQLNTALLRFFPGRKKSGHAADDVASVILLGALIGLLLAGLSTLASPWLARLFLGSEQYASSLSWAFAVLPAGIVLNLLFMYLRASRQIGLYSGLLIAESCGYIVLSLVFLNTGYGIVGVVWALLVVRLLIGGITGLVAFKKLGLQMPTFSCIGLYLRFCLPLLPVGIFVWVNSLSDRYVISFFSGPEATGVYSISYALGSIVGLFFAPISFVLPPAITELWEEDRHSQIKEYLFYGQKYPLLLAFPALIAMTVLNRLFIENLATAQFMANPLLIALTASGIIVMNMSAYVENMVRLAGKTSIFPLYYGICSLFNMVANVVVVPLVGLEGAAAATFLTYALLLGLMYSYVRPIFAFEWNMSFVLKGGLAGLAMGLVLMPFRDGDLVMQLSGLVFGVVVYMAALFLM